MEIRKKHERKITITGGIYDAYVFYRKEKIKPLISRTIYAEICKDFNERISNKIITESFEFKLPYRLGYLRIKAVKQKIKIKNGEIDTQKMPVDWKTTWEMWHNIYPNKSKKEIINIKNKKLVVHTNEHSDGYIFKWYWDKRLSNLKNQTVYKFKPVKGGITSSGKYTGRLGIKRWDDSNQKNNSYYE